MRVLAAEHRVNLDEFTLKPQRLNIMGHGHEVGFRGQTIGGVSPIAAGEKAQLFAVHQRSHAILNRLEIRLARFWPSRDGLRQLRRLNRVGLQRQRDVNPIESMQVIEVNDVILNQLSARNDVADKPGSIGDLDSQRAFDGANGRQGMHHGADAADTLRPDPCFPRIAIA
jgi:hypothetical protein